MRLQHVLWALVGFCSACGARSDLGGGSGGSADASTPCATQPWILFDYADGSTGTSNIYAMHADGSALHPVDLGGNRGSWPSISPDGTKLLYVEIANDGETIVLRDLATHAEHTVADGSYPTKAAISPSNALIAYGDQQDLRIVSADGTGDHVLAHGDVSGWCGYPAFSTDSSTVYFAAGSKLESIHADGSATQALTQDQPTSNYGALGWGGSLSPDGARLAAPFVCGVLQLRVLPVASLPGDPCAAGTKLAEMAAGFAATWAAPSWGPGDVIAYHDGKDVLLVGASGGASTNITSKFTNTKGWAGNPVWAPGCAGL
ncbi:MAG TPA: hypothetical protein VLM85_33550 [Polyangiaceae bacterium]|nr:hypothetical protein [Polyangiaceae bacterium]